MLLAYLWVGLLLFMFRGKIMLNTLNAIKIIWFQEHPFPRIFYSSNTELDKNATEKFGDTVFHILHI